MRRFSETDIGLIEPVNAHLVQLVTATRYDADQASLRAVSGSLRFLLADDYLARAWKASGIGGAMTFRTLCIVSTEGSEVIA
jgi:hypothetical protein